MSDTDTQREIAYYTTLGLAVVGLSWHEARRIAKEIVAEKQSGAYGKGEK